MKAELFGTFLSVCLMSLCVCAENRVWTGGGGDANWSTAANWGGTAPAANDTLTFSGTVRLENINDLSPDTLIGGITFSNDAGAFTLSGNRITLNGNVSNLSANEHSIDLPVVLSETSTFNTSDGAITVNGSISGTGGLTKIGGKKLTLTANNSYDGITTIDNGIIIITHGNALGSTNGNTVVNAESGGYLQLSGGITVPEPLYLNWQRPNTSGIRALDSLYNLDGSNTLSGEVTCYQTKIYMAPNSALVFSGGITNIIGYLTFSVTYNSALVFSEKPVLSPGNLLYILNNGVVIVDAPGNVWTITQIITGGSVRTDQPNALPIDSLIDIRKNTSQLNLNGNDQTVAGISDNCDGIITSDMPATLTLNQTKNTLYKGSLKGAVNLLKAGAGTLTLANSSSTTTGDITVTNGTLAVTTDNSLGNSTNVTVLGGTLDLRTQYGIVDTASLSISNGQVKIATGLTERVGQLFLDGVQKKRGSWGTTASGATHVDDTHFSGDGIIYVLNSPPIAVSGATWDAGGADTLLSTAENWAGDVLPSFDGATHAVFGDNGNTATVDTAVSLYGITFNSTNDFTLTPGAGAVTLGAGGITAAGSDTPSRLYEVAVNLTLEENSTWHIAAGESEMATLKVSGNIGNSDDALGFTKTGKGKLILSGNNSFDDVVTVNDGMLHITHDNALGTTNGNTVVNAESGGYLQLSGDITVQEPLYLNWQRLNASGFRTDYSLYSLSGSNTLSGEVTCDRTRIHMADYTTLVFEGGLTNIDGSVVMNVPANSKMIFCKLPVRSHGQVMYLFNTGLYVFSVSDNVWSKTQIYSASKVRTDVPNALPFKATLEMNDSNSKLDLNGNDQTTAGIINSSKGIIQSESAARLIIDQGTDAIYLGRLAGAVSILKAGTATLTLSNNLSETTGDVTVTNGTLALAMDNSLGNSTNITVTGANARLELRTSAGIVDTATLTIANDGAKVNLLGSVNEAVSWLYLDGKMKRAGTYGSTDSSAFYKDDAYFSGTGILTVLHDQAGTVIIVR